MQELLPKLLAGLGLPPSAHSSSSDSLLHPLDDLILRREITTVHNSVRSRYRHLHHFFIILYQKHHVLSMYFPQKGLAAPVLQLQFISNQH